MLKRRGRILKNNETSFVNGPKVAMQPSHLLLDLDLQSVFMINGRRGTYIPKLHFLIRYQPPFAYKGVLPTSVGGVAGIPSVCYLHQRF